eukprot:CAMPEP_0183502510 /NCGR_PEP_ID=MMETSP0371-20130417/4273_1 /TAXON_ID=268820 /ORGANISM="Peridinium aciculiferum, Strain PAER-2" /LENGTH=58 /DNA_ID=CAMNT_0025697241 /DNA_START=50 /DNA_END=222 /DNA_ORIENTATION=+
MHTSTDSNNCVRQNADKPNGEARYNVAGMGWTSATRNGMPFLALPEYPETVGVLPRCG